MTTQNATAHKNTNAAPLLPREKSQALNMMIRITQSLVTLAERESQALAMNDLLSFAILQDEKILVTEQYIRMSEEFRTNVEFYRGADRVLLDRLENLQNALAEKTRSNNVCVADIYGRAKGRVQNSLITAQELGQQRPVNFTAMQEATQDA